MGTKQKQKYCNALLLIQFCHEFACMFEVIEPLLKSQLIKLDGLNRKSVLYAVSSEPKSF